MLRVKAEDAAHEVRIAFDQEDLRQRARGRGRVGRVHRFNPVIGNGPANEGGRRMRVDRREAEEPLEASTRLTGTTRTCPVSGEFE
jgi:hypothetical protein